MAHDVRSQPSVESLEDRQLLSTTTSSNTSYYIYLAEHKDHQYVSDLQAVELKSQATPAQYLALNNDAKAISADAATTTLAPAVANTKAVAVSLQLDRSVLEGWLGASGWATIETQLETNLDGLNVPQTLIDQTVTDMKTLGQAAGVTYSEKANLDLDAEQLQDAENNLLRYRITGYHFPTPELYFTQHLRGFARGGAVQRKADQATLNTDIASFAASAADRALLHRDAGLLEQIGTRVTTAANRQVGDAYLSAFASGAPTTASQAQAKTGMLTALGTSATAATLSAVDRVLADAPALFPAAGSAVDHVQTLVNDAQALVADGADSPLNPFKVQIVRPANPS